MPNNRHVFLSNPEGIKSEFNRKRGWDNNNQNNDDDIQETEEPKVIQEFQKETLRTNNAEFYLQRKARNNNRTVQFSAIIDLIRIHFFCVFNKDLKSKFYAKYGLSAIEYSNFNKTVLFEISDEALFQDFIKHIQEVVRTSEGTSYVGKSFNLIALILQFEFINSRNRVLTFNEDGVLLILISSGELVYREQKSHLLEYLKAQNIEVSYNDSNPDIIEVSMLPEEQRELIANNYDIIKAITSARTLQVRPGVYGTVRRDYGFSVITPGNLTTVGIIDTGVSNQITPLKELIINTSFDHTGKGAFWDEVGHGSSVAGLIAFGKELPHEVKDSYLAKARLLVIKAIHNVNDPIDIPKLLADIRDARRKDGVRLFNMSLNLPFAKQYNSTYGQLAYELDKLAYEEDVLIFISVGNINDVYLHEMIDENHPDHEYPLFFYNPTTTSEFHSCRTTNISEPSESLNNISVGALAGNLEEADMSDISPNNFSPAYYTRKFHFDYTQKINGSPLRKNQRNKFLNKPDLVFDGGDLFNDASGIQILKQPMADGGGYYGRSCGTSLATPVITSYAAEILNTYPELLTQTVKALLINSATYYKKKELPSFSSSTDFLLKSLTGFGTPKKEGFLFTDDNSVMFIIEKKIKNKQIIGIPLYLPEYLKNTNNKLKFDITLCYSFMPIRDNHLNYLPMHMSVNIIRNVDMDIIANKKGSEYHVKPSFSWSEDHFGLENCLFSNTQSISRNLQPSDIVALDGSVVLGLRCLVKTNIPAMSAYSEDRAHRFSLVVKITELPENSASGQLYNEILACNTIEQIAETIVDIDLENDLI